MHSRMIIFFSHFELQWSTSLPGQQDPSHLGCWPTDVEQQLQLGQPAAVFNCFYSILFIMSLHVHNAAAGVTKLKQISPGFLCCWKTNGELLQESFQQLKIVVLNDLNPSFPNQKDHIACCCRKESPDAWLCSTPLHLEGPISKKENSHGAWTTPKILFSMFSSQEN